MQAKRCNRIQRPQTAGHTLHSSYGRRLLPQCENHCGSTLQHVQTGERYLWIELNATPGAFYLFLFPQLFVIEEVDETQRKLIAMWRGKNTFCIVSIIVIARAIDMVFIIPAQPVLPA